MNLTSNWNSVQIDKRKVKVKGFGTRTTKPNVETIDINVACVHCLSENYFTVWIIFKSNRKLHPLKMVNTH